MASTIGGPEVGDGEADRETTEKKQTEDSNDKRETSEGKVVTYFPSMM